MPQFEQMSIFDVLPEKDWGDARPEPKTKTKTTIKDHYERHYEWDQYNPDIAPVEVKTLPETADNVCVWCGGEFSDLTTHEDDCSPS